jgi:tetratricopeptide (TPR) repeat protein
MSILDGLPKSAEEMRAAFTGGAEALRALAASDELSPKMRSILDELNDGQSMADIMGITKEERDAMLLQGFRLLQGGNAAAAQDLLTTLHNLEPLDERVIYALGAAFQAQEDYAQAGRLYLLFLSLDATNPEGYLRLAECFMGNGETEQAAACFEVAKIEAGRRAPRPDLAAYADRMLAAIEGGKAA